MHVSSNVHYKSLLLFAEKVNVTRKYVADCQQIMSLKLEHLLSRLHDVQKCITGERSQGRLVLCKNKLRLPHNMVHLFLI